MTNVQNRQPARRSHVHLTGKQGRQPAARSNYSEPRGGSPFARSLKAAAGQTAAPAAPAVVEPDAPVELSAKTRHLVDDLRQPFIELAETQGSFSKGSKAMSAKFYKTFRAWTGETKGTFVAFVTLLDPSVPADRDSYRAHSSYQAADYLRRLERAKERAAADPGDTENAEKPATPVQALAILLSSMAPVVDDMSALWTAIEERLHWSHARVKNLQQLVGQSPPPLLEKAPNERKLHVAAAA